MAVLVFLHGSTGFYNLCYQATLSSHAFVRAFVDVAATYFAVRFWSNYVGFLIPRITSPPWVYGGANITQNMQPPCSALADYLTDGDDYYNC